MPKTLTEFMHEAPERNAKARAKLETPPAPDSLREAAEAELDKGGVLAGRVKRMPRGVSLDEADFEQLPKP